MKRLTKSRDNKMVSGVLAGIAEYFGFDPSILRIIYAVATFFGVGSPIILYIILAIVIPESPRGNRNSEYTGKKYDERKKAQRKEAERPKEEDWSDF